MKQFNKKSVHSNNQAAGEKPATARTWTSSSLLPFCFNLGIHLLTKPLSSLPASWTMSRITEEHGNTSERNVQQQQNAQTTPSSYCDVTQNKNLKWESSLPTLCKLLNWSWATERWITIKFTWKHHFFIQIVCLSCPHFPIFALFVCGWATADVCAKQQNGEKPTHPR